MDSSSQLLWYASTALSAGVLFRICRERLHSIAFQGFAIMLAVSLARDLLLLIPSFGTREWSGVWVATLPGALIAQVIAALSAYAAIAGLYPRIGRFAVWLFGVATLLTAIISCAGLPFEIDRIGGREAVLRSLFLVDRWVHTLMVGALLLALAFLARFPRPLKRMPGNLSLHIVLLSFYFSGYSVLPFLLNVFQLQHALWAQVSQSLLVIILYAVWASSLSAEGEMTEEWPQIAPEVSRMIEIRNRRAIELGNALAQGGLSQAVGCKESV